MKHNWKIHMALWMAIAVTAVQGVAYATEQQEMGRGSTGEVKGLLYRIRNESNTLYLLGSIHIGNAEMIPYGEALQAAMEASGTFLFECDTSSSAAVKATRNTMYYTDRTALQDVIHPELYTKLETVCTQNGLAVGDYKKMKPWAVVSMLSFQTTAAQMGADSLQAAQELGVETVVRAYAKQHKKNIGYVETTQEQLDVMDSYSMPLQEYLLEEVLDTILTPAVVVGLDADMSKWPSWWRDGNAQAFVDSFEEGYASAADKALVDEYYGGLLYKRNATMAGRLDAMMKEAEGHTYFATIGLLHVVLPEDSIVTHMQQLGYEVTYLSGE